MTRIIIQGINGRMGKVLCELIEQREDCRVVGGVDVTPQSGAIPVAASLEELNVEADVLIDFSSPAATRNALRFCAKNALPCVICTTGLDEDTEKLLTEASTRCAVFKSANMSMGINLLAQLAQQAATALGLDYDIEIIEKHHNRKLDAPSGTALMLADAINEQNDGAYHYVYDRSAVRAKRDPKEIGISAVRGGSIVGDHEVLFCGPDEVITLKHTAYSRSIFANGAINAAVYLAKKDPGLYNMNDLIAEL